MYSASWHWWRLKRKVRRTTAFALRIGLVASLLLMAVVWLLWPESGDELRRFSAPAGTEGRQVKPLGNEEVRIFRGDQMEVRPRPKSPETVNKPPIKIFRGSGMTLQGQARAIDGDTLDMGGVRVRLHGIDAPEIEQRCWSGGRRWPCGQYATQALRSLIGNETVECEKRDRDSYGRVLAACRAGGRDLGTWMVAEGWALAYRQYSLAYMAEESRARAARRGVWQGEFVTPYEWRKGRRLGHEQNH